MVEPSSHLFKYGLSYPRTGEPVLRLNREPGTTETEKVPWQEGMAQTPVKSSKKGLI